MNWSRLRKCKSCFRTVVVQHAHTGHKVQLPRGDNLMNCHLTPPPTHDGNIPNQTRGRRESSSWIKDRHKQQPDLEQHKPLLEKRLALHIIRLLQRRRNICSSYMSWRHWGERGENGVRGCSRLSFNPPGSSNCRQKGSGVTGVSVWDCSLQRWMKPSWDCCIKNKQCYLTRRRKWVTHRCRQVAQVITYLAELMLCCRFHIQ